MSLIEFNKKPSTFLLSGEVPLEHSTCQIFVARTRLRQLVFLKKLSPEILVCKCLVFRLPKYGQSPTRGSRREEAAVPSAAPSTSSRVRRGRSGRCDLRQPSWHSVASPRCSTPPVDPCPCLCGGGAPWAHSQSVPRTRASLRAWWLRGTWQGRGRPAAAVDRPALQVFLTLEIRLQCFDVCFSFCRS